MRHAGSSSPSAPRRVVRSDPAPESMCEWPHRRPHSCALAFPARLKRQPPSDSPSPSSEGGGLASWLQQRFGHAPDALLRIAVSQLLEREHLLGRQLHARMADTAGSDAEGTHTCHPNPPARLLQPPKDDRAEKGGQGSLEEVEHLTRRTEPIRDVLRHAELLRTSAAGGEAQVVCSSAGGAKRLAIAIESVAKNLIGDDGHGVVAESEKLAGRRLRS